MALALLLLAGCEGPLPKVVIKLGEGDSTATDSLRPFLIATDDAEATRVGAALLKAGGTAGDAAAAAALTLAVTLPSSASLHAAGACLVHDAATKATHVIHFTGAFATARAARTIHGVLGALPWAQAVAPAATAARFGAPVSSALATQLAHADVLLNDARSLAVFMSPRRQLLTQGEQLRQPALADALDRLRVTPRGATAGTLAWTPAAAQRSGDSQVYAAGESGADANANADASSGFVVGDSKGNAVACAFTLGQAFGTGVMQDGALLPQDSAAPSRLMITADAKGRVLRASAGPANGFVCRLDNGAPQCEARTDAPGGYALTGQPGEP